MTTEQKQVEQFMRRVGQEIPEEPTHISTRCASFRADLIQEELDEYIEASIGGESLPEVADAIADLMYVVLGTAVAHGIDIEPIFQEVHRSNMSKFTDGHRREDGKWIKGPSYSPANLGPILENQTQIAIAREGMVKFQNALGELGK
jgi:predicted HAD superfamily Cof-like phosphohydrolase